MRNNKHYSYDAVGNMLTKGNIKYTYNAGNQLVSDGVDKYAYDRNGNLTQKGDIQYTYNARNLLESYVSDEYSESYTYNAFGLLSSIQQNDVTTTLIWDILNGDGVVISAAKNGKITDYSYGLERISAHSKGMRTEYVTDITGSVIAEVNSRFLGGDVSTKSYSPFGELLTDNSTGFGYNGEYYNSATGLVYLRARFYEPEMNRFSQKDAYRGITASTTSLNRYAYCYNDPVNYKDPSGKLGLLAGAAIVGGIVGGVVGAVKSIATQKASGGTVSVKTVIKSAAVGVVAGAVGAVVATAATVALATTFGAATITGAASLTMAQSIGVGSISAVLGGVASRYSGAVTSNAINAGAYVDPVSSAFNSSAMLTDLVFGGFAGAATGYATDGIYQTYESLRYEQNIRYTSSRSTESPDVDTPKSLGVKKCNGKDLAKNADELDDAITATRSAGVESKIEIASEGSKNTNYKLTENTTFVRVYDKTNSRMQGGWVMKAEDIAGLTPQEIQNKFALPNTPKYICDVNLEAGIKLRSGEVNPLFGFDGGGQQ